MQLNLHNNIYKTAVATLKTEAKAIEELEKYIDKDFICCVLAIKSCSGRIVLTGIGKSAIIAQKIAATFNSTGTPAMFMHAADAVHGDLGMIQPNDLVICLSKSGETPEIKMLVPLLKARSNTLVAMVGKVPSYLSKQSKYVLNTTVSKEACPNNLAPTSSTTAQLALGDALAVCVLELRGFTGADFAQFHPGGALGKQLYLTLADIISTNSPPIVYVNNNLNQIIIEMTSKRLGATAVLNLNGTLAGIITDGDLRRALQKYDANELHLLTAKQIMNKNPKMIEQSELAINALRLMEDNKINQIIVLYNTKYMGMVHIHDILQQGIA